MGKTSSRLPGFIVAPQAMTVPSISTWFSSHSTTAAGGGLPQPAVSKTSKQRSLMVGRIEPSKAVP
ncbi:MAG: hypothetical protein HY816_04365 [Candidatus Wallbacteria bacterium]|nr:hypothetical protein [Candidatus Wallbacteria bacterium]